MKKIMSFSTLFWSIFKYEISILEVSKRFTEMSWKPVNLKNSPKCRNIFIDGLDLDVLSFVKMSLGDIRSDLT